MKRIYERPTFRAVEIKKRNTVLMASFDPEKNEEGGDGSQALGRGGVDCNPFADEDNVDDEW